MTNLYNNKKSYGAYLKAKEELNRTIKTTEECLRLFDVTEEQINETYGERIEAMKADLNSDNYQTKLEEIKVFDKDGKLVDKSSNEFYPNPFQRIIGYVGMNSMGGSTYTVTINGKLNDELTNTFNALFGGEQ